MSSVYFKAAPYGLTSVRQKGGLPAPVIPLLESLAAQGPYVRLPCPGLARARNVPRHSGLLQSDPGPPLEGLRRRLSRHSGSRDPSQMTFLVCAGKSLLASAAAASRYSACWPGHQPEGLSLSQGPAGILTNLASRHAWQKFKSLSLLPKILLQSCASNWNTRTFQIVRSRHAHSI